MTTQTLISNDGHYKAEGYVPGPGGKPTPGAIGTTYILEGNNNTFALNGGYGNAFILKGNDNHVSLTGNDNRVADEGQGNQIVVDEPFTQVWGLQNDLTGLISLPVGSTYSLHADGHGGTDVAFAWNGHQSTIDVIGDTKVAGHVQVSNHL